MKFLKYLFSTQPADEFDDPSDWPLWNRTWEHHGPRLRVIVGDLLAEQEREYGGFAGLQFGIDVSLAQEDSAEFIVEAPGMKYDTYSCTLIFWRWGIYVAVRGRLYR